MKKRQSTFITFFLLVAISVMGCSGPSNHSDPPTASDSEQINSILDQYEQAMRDEDAEKLAGLYTYPIRIGQYFENVEQAIGYYTFAFFFMEVHEFRITERNITLAERDAVAEIAGISKITIFDAIHDEQEFSGKIKFKKVGNIWKISGATSDDEESQQSLYNVFPLSNI